MARVNMMDPYMRQNILLLVVSKSRKRILSEVIVKIRQVDEGAPKTIDRLCPPLKLLSKVHHLTVSHITQLPFGRLNLPFFSAQGAYDQPPSFGDVLNLEQIYHPNH